MLHANGVKTLYPPASTRQVNKLSHPLSVVTFGYCGVANILQLTPQWKGTHTVGTKTSTDQHAALPSDGFEIHDVEHMYNKGHTEGTKKVHMHVLIGELCGHGSINMDTKPQRRKSLAWSQYKSTSEAKYTNKSSPFLQYWISNH